MSTPYVADMRVEVLLTEEGLAGSRYAGRIIEVAKAKALVEFEAFNEENSEALLREWHLIKYIQPVPPPMPDGFLKRLTQSDDVEVFHDDGWWVMSFGGTRAGADGTEYNVRSDLYQLERWVAADSIRPHWERWGMKWRQLEQMRKPTQPKVAAPSLKATPATAKAAGAPAASTAKAAAAPAASRKASSPVKPGPAIKAAPHMLPPSELTAPLAPAAISGTQIGGAHQAADVALPAPRALPSMSASCEALCAKLLRKMRACDDAIWFAQPVDVAEVPDYLAVVAYPMDYATVDKKLHAGEYRASPLAFAADMRRIFSNALTYNWDPEQDCHRASMRALRQFERQFADVLAAHVAHAGGEAGGEEGGEEGDGEGAARGTEQSGTVTGDGDDDEGCGDDDDKEDKEDKEDEEDVIMDDKDEQDDDDDVMVPLPVSPVPGEAEGEDGTAEKDGAAAEAEEAEAEEEDRGAVACGVRGPLGAAADEAEMETLRQFVVACGGDEHALDGWLLERQASPPHISQ